MSAGHNTPTLISKFRKSIYGLNLYRPCSYCGIEIHISHASVDHIIPRSKGGSNQTGNLCICCHACNNQKGSSPKEEWNKIKAFSWYAVMLKCLKNSGRLNKINVHEKNGITISEWCLKDRPDDEEPGPKCFPFGSKGRRATARSKKILRRLMLASYNQNQLLLIKRNETEPRKAPKLY